MRTFRRNCDEFDILSLPAKGRKVARTRQDRVNHKYQRATRVVERLLQAHGGCQEERRPPAGGGHREERKYRDDFGAGRTPDQRMEYEDSVPIERRPILPVTEILAAERQERSWESAPGAGWSRPAMADRGRGIGDLGMAGLNIVHQHASREAEGPAHRWVEAQGSCPAHIPALPRGWTTGGGLR
jgi:hypothetical protein